MTQVHSLIEQGQLAHYIQTKHPEQHDVRSDGALFDYVDAIKQRYLRHAPAVNKAVYDNKLQVVQHALGTHTTISRVQGSKLQAKHEIRVASVFRQAPANFLKMIVVHELAHLKQAQHNKAFYQLCTHMEPNYPMLELDLRLYLTLLELPTV